MEVDIQALLLVSKGLVQGSQPLLPVKDNLGVIALDARRILDSFDALCHWQVRSIPEQNLARGVLTIKGVNQFCDLWPLPDIGSLDFGQQNLATIRFLRSIRGPSMGGRSCAVPPALIPKKPV